MDISYIHYWRVSPQGGEAVVINRTQRQRSEAAVARKCGLNSRIIVIINTPNFEVLGANEA